MCMRVKMSLKVGTLSPGTIEGDIREENLNLSPEHGQPANISWIIFTYLPEPHGQLPTSPRGHSEWYAGIKLKQLNDIGLCQTVHVSGRVDRCCLYNDRCIRAAAIGMLRRYAQQEILPRPYSLGTSWPSAKMMG